MKKRILSMILTVVMVIGVVPVVAVFGSEPVTIIVGHTNGTVTWSNVNSALSAAGLNRFSTPFTVEFTDGVTAIGQSAFSNCTSMVGVKLLVDTPITIGGFAFNNCTSLVDITLPADTLTIGIRAFRDCTSLASITIPNGVTAIGSEAFSNCTSLTSITIPEGVIEIGSAAFANCTSLMNINADEANSNFSSENGVLFNKDKSRLIAYPARKLDTHYSIPEGVIAIDSYAFSNARDLISVTIPEGVAHIPYAAFALCESLKTIVIPNSVISIYILAFAGCSSLTSVSIGDNIEYIEVGAFNSCTELASIMFRKTTPPMFGFMPDPVPEGGGSLMVGQGVFSNNPKLTTIYVPVGSKELYQAEWQLKGYNIIEFCLKCDKQLCQCCVVCSDFPCKCCLDCGTFPCSVGGFCPRDKSCTAICGKHDCDYSPTYCSICDDDPCSVGGFCAANGTCTIDCGKHNCDFATYCTLCNNNPCLVGGLCLKNQSCTENCGKHDCDYIEETTEIEIITQDRKIGNVDIFAGSILIEAAGESGEITISASDLNGIKTDNMWLFKVEGDKVSASGKPTVANGSITATVESGSTYVLQRIQPGSIRNKGKITENRNDITISDALHTLMAVAKMPSSDAYGDNADARSVRAAKVNDPEASEIGISDALQVLMFVAKMPSSKVVLLEA